MLRKGAFVTAITCAALFAFADYAPNRPVTDVANTYTASQNVASVALTDGATISTNAALGNDFSVTIAGNRTMANPTNLVSGGTYQWEIIQDATGSRTIAWGATFKWPGASAPTLQTSAGAKDLISCLYDGTDLLCGSLAGTAGTSTKLAAAYAAGASQTDSTLALDSTRLGVRIRDNATPISGSLMSVQNSGGTVNYCDINASGTQTITSGMADGASAILLQLKTVATWSNTGVKLLDFVVNGVEQFYLGQPAANGWWEFRSQTAQIGLRNSSASGYFAASNTSYIYDTGSAVMQLDGTSVRPNADLTGPTVGDSTHRWLESWARRYAGVEQTIAAAASITLDPASGETIRVTLSATAVTTINAGTGKPGEHMTVEIIQDATGSRSISGWSASYLLAGGSYTVTATANKRDVLTFAWDNTDSKWVEQSRSMNL